VKYFKVLVATLHFFVLAVFVYLLHVRYFKVDVVFYSAITDGIIATILGAMLLFGWSYFSLFTVFEKILIVVIFAITSYALAISVPTVIDRSLSFYILEKIEQRGGGIRQDSFEQVFTQEYVSEHRLVDVRLTEQLESGTLSIEKGCVKLTAKGKRLVQFSRYFRQNWLPKRRLLMGKYSDDLTDPFRNSTEKIGYECK
jgi:hypothetical protein